jgi:hypothetical protein
MRYLCLSGACLVLIASTVYGQTDLAAQAPFSASPAAVRSAFNAVSAGEEGATILLEAATYELESNERQTLRHHLIYKVFTKEAAGNWDTIGLIACAAKSPRAARTILFRVHISRVCGSSRQPPLAITQPFG